jgi:hypothetical protein
MFRCDVCEDLNSVEQILQAFHNHYEWTQHVKLLEFFRLLIEIGGSTHKNRPNA